MPYLKQKLRVTGSFYCKHAVLAFWDTHPTLVMLYNSSSMLTLKDNLLVYLKARKRVRPGQISEDYHLSRTRIHQVLKELVAEGKVARSGKVPRVYYHLVRTKLNQAKK